MASKSPRKELKYLMKIIMRSTCPPSRSAVAIQPAWC